MRLNIKSIILGLPLVALTLLPGCMNDGDSGNYFTFSEFLIVDSYSVPTKVATMSGVALYIPQLDQELLREGTCLYAQGKIDQDNQPNANGFTVNELYSEEKIARYDATSYSDSIVADPENVPVTYFTVGNNTPIFFKNTLFMSASEQTNVPKNFEYHVAWTEYSLLSETPTIYVSAQSTSSAVGSVFAVGLDDFISACEELGKVNDKELQFNIKYCEGLESDNTTPKFSTPISVKITVD